MHRCDACKVLVHPQHGFCPLCGKRLGTPGESATAYPRYAADRSTAGFTLGRLVCFLLIAVSAICVFINIFTYRQAPSLWSALVVLSLVFPVWIVGVVRARKADAGRKILKSYGIVAAFVIGLDLFSGFAKWSTTYVLPFLTICVALVFTVLAVRSKKKFTQYLGNLLAVFFISLCPAIIYLFSLSTQAWSSLVALLYCLLTVAGLVIFMGESFREEIKKRFHF